MLYELTRLEFANTSGDDAFYYDGTLILMGVFNSFNRAYDHIEKEHHDFSRVTSPDPYMDEIYGVPYLHLRDAVTSNGKPYTTGVLFYISFLDYISDEAKRVYYMYKDDLAFPLYLENKNEADEQIRYYIDKANIRYDTYTSSKRKGRVVLYARHNQDYMVVEQIPVNQYFEGGL